MKNFKLLAFCSIIIAGLLLTGSGLAGNAHADGATAPNLTPQAWYQFDDADDIGKDAMGNNHLRLLNSSTAATAQIKEDGIDGDKYLELKRTGQKAGKGLYAPGILAGKDFSDLINKSFSVEITFRGDVLVNHDVNDTVNKGNHYLLTVGTYFDSFSIRQWGNSIDVVVGNRTFAPEGTPEPGQQGYADWRATYTRSIPYTVDTWATLLVSANQVTKTATIYLNGVEQAKIEDLDVLFTYDSNYTFAIGMQATSNGNNGIQFATADIKDCKVFDYALTAENAAALYSEGAAVVSDGVTYITAVEELELPPVFITDIKTPETILAELPDKVATTLSNGASVQADVIWYRMPNENRIRGYVQSPFANVKGLDYNLSFEYTIDFDYNPQLVTVSDVKLNGVGFTPGTPINTDDLNVLTFKLLPLDGSVIDSVKWFGMDFTPINGEYQITPMGGATIIISVSVEKFTVRYYDGETSLGTSTFTKGGNEALSSYPKEGYTFEGWYSDAELTVKVTALDYANPADITLYAKYTKDRKSGCGSAVGGIAPIITVFGVIAVFAIAGVLIRRARFSK